ncbi:7TM diverse intracellular signaling domain-containing protein [Pandoraea sputorum]|uniref:sensor histidine kinase n=1 Tax=Pandoraea sputorum TaxID=93222 RepID=UPI002F3FCC43
MSHQEHLQEVGGQFTHTGRVRSPRLRLVALTLITLIALLWLFAATAHAQRSIAPRPVSDASLPFEHIEAVRGDWQATQPPNAGWIPVTLPDVWTSHWPRFDGVVWYRLTWQEPSPVKARGLMLEYLNMAGMVYLNGSLISRDDSLVEPLSRAWNTPRHWVVDAPTLRAGSNVLLVRVSGLAAYSPGLGPVLRGSPDDIRSAYDKARWLRHDLQLFSLAITVTLGVVVLTLWLYRRQETSYGWFSLMSFAWWLYAVNQIVTRPWPFATNDGWQLFVSIAFLFYCACFTMFVLRFCGRRMPRIEAAMWITFGVGAATLIVAPRTYTETLRAIWAVVPGMTWLATCVLLFVLTWRERQTEQRIVSLCALVFVAAGLHDFLVFFGILDTNVYYTAQTSQILMIGMAVVLARRFANNARRISQFNEELKQAIDDARGELSSTLNRQHELQVANVRLAERLNLAHDLHDGLGGTLVSGIAAIEHAPHTLPPERFLALLKELRDELRFVVDSATVHQAGEQALAEQIASLRHRMTARFEIQMIECEWRVEGIERCEMGAARSLEVQRILQEALTNVLKHSKASCVRVGLHDVDGEFTLRVEDNGVGFDTGRFDDAGETVPRASHEGTGLHSMKRRAQKLGGTMTITREGGCTVLCVRMGTA